RWTRTTAWSSSRAAKTTWSRARRTCSTSGRTCWRTSPPTCRRLILRRIRSRAALSRGCSCGSPALRLPPRRTRRSRRTRPRLCGRVGADRGASSEHSVEYSLRDLRVLRGGKRSARCQTGMVSALQREQHVVAAHVPKPEPRPRVEPPVGVVHASERVDVVPDRSEVLGVRVVRARHLEEVVRDVLEVAGRGRRDLELVERALRRVQVF